MLEELNRRRLRSKQQRIIDTYYPDDGPLSRDKYAKHIEFFDAGAIHQERAFIAGNRAGKSFAMSYEGTCHLTGDYPKWWNGRRFSKPITCWAAGEDAKAVRESLQQHLLGPMSDVGTGLIPKDSLINPRSRAGIPDAIDFVGVKHVTGGQSRLVLKSFDQRRESFQGAQVDVIMLDEEPPLDIYTECLTRTLSTTPGEPNGIVMAAFTPLKGLSETVLQFLPGGAMPRTEEQRLQAWGWSLAFMSIAPLYQTLVEWLAAANNLI